MLDKNALNGYAKNLKIRLCPKYSGIQPYKKMTIMRYSKVRDVKSPERGTSKSAGIDFFVPNDSDIINLMPGQDVLIPSGIKAELPEGYMLMAADKSGIATSALAKSRAGMKTDNSLLSCLIIGAKIIDEDYQGEIHIHIINVGLSSVVITPGMKIAQFILVPVLYENMEEVPESELFNTETERGEGGFGSTNEQA